MEMVEIWMVGGEFMNKKALTKAVIEFILETGRMVILAVVPLLIIMISPALENKPVTINFALIQWTAVLVVLRGLDKALHEAGKAINNESLTRGLTRF